VRLEHPLCIGKKKASSSKSKEVLVDEESLKVIENQEFIAIRTAEKIWPSSVEGG
jgi:hypothetical protein